MLSEIAEIFQGSMVKETIRKCTKRDNRKRVKFSAAQRSLAYSPASQLFILTGFPTVKLRVLAILASHSLETENIKRSAISLQLELIS